MPWDEDTDSETESDSDNTGGVSQDTELKQLHMSIRTAVTSLMRLSVAVREPAPHDQLEHTFAVEMRKSYLEEYDRKHVQEKFDDVSQYLTERLVKAASSRRWYLTYCEAHCAKLSEGIEALGRDDTGTEYTTVTSTDHTVVSTEATPLPQSTRVHDVGIPDDRSDAASQTSYATSIGDTIRVPSLPRESSSGEPYVCPLCFRLISIQTTAAWK